MIKTVELPTGYYANGNAKPHRTAEVLTYKDGWMRVRYRDNGEEETVTAKAILKIHSDCIIEETVSDAVEKDFHIRRYCEHNCGYKCLTGKEYKKIAEVAKCI